MEEEEEEEEVARKRGMYIEGRFDQIFPLFPTTISCSFPKPIVDVISQVTLMPNDLVTGRKKTTRTTRSKVGKENGKGHKAEKINF
jgi:hypothetical protein